tara:strand:+ start:2679 stop:3869 length:1191 start_codon:yes stop_codon:yes gene_type:complete
MIKNIYYENPPNNSISKIYWILAFIIVGAHQFSLPFLPYILIILFGNKKITYFFKDKTNYLILILITSSIISLILREYPLFEALNLSRFFFGLPFIFLFLTPNLISKLKYPVVISFIIWNLIELIITFATGEAPFYIRNFFMNEWGVSEAFKRSQFFGNTRLFGPALNASVNGSISACLLVASLFNKELIFGNLIISKLQKKLVAIFSAIIFFLSASGTGTVTIIFLLANKYIWPTFSGITRNFRLKTFSLIFLLLAIAAILPIIIFAPTWLSKLEFKYFSVIYEVKLEDFLTFIDLNSIDAYLFGINYDPKALFLSDFVILSLISSFGLIYLFFLLFIFQKIFQVQRIYFYALLISSLHYGTLFTVTGQVLCSIIFSTKIVSTSSKKTRSFMVDK